jgi:DNA-binding MarR family transcriptional regulator
VTRSRLEQPAALTDMLLYRINRLRAVGGGMVLRYCEGHFGVTRREWVMLALLSIEESATPSQLAERAELNKSATSKAITTLARKGLIMRDPRRGDRRYVQLKLTESGKKLYAQILPLVADVNRQLMSALAPQEIAALDGMLDRMEAQADAMAQQLSQLPRADRRRGGTRRAPPAAEAESWTRYS